MFKTSKEKSTVEPRQIVTYHSEVTICNQFQKFWEFEEIPDEKKKTLDEDICESYYKSTHKRKSKGVYSVVFPFKTINHFPPVFGKQRLLPD